MTKELKIAIIDYGAGNLGSVRNAITRLGYKARVTNKPEEVLEASAVILPGVGAAGDTVDSLEQLGLNKAIYRLVDENRPLFAVCVGLQILLTGSEEGGWHKCLDIVSGRVKKLPGGLKIPHIGWNQVKQQTKSYLFNGIPDEANFYFVHSYYASPDDTALVGGTTDYGTSFCSALIKDNLVATQFHPEKSANWGLRMYANFLERALTIEKER
jgi:glutamine amidotransferase